MASESIKVYNVTAPYIECQSELGEGPYYDEPNGLLRFISPLENKLHFVDLAKGPQSDKIVDTHGNAIGVTANIEGSKSHFAFAGAEAFGIWNLQNSTFKNVKELWTEQQKAAGEAKKWRMNDGGVDSKGRFWAGVMTRAEPLSFQMKREGWLLRYDVVKGTLTRVIESLGVPNGISWSPDDKTMYYTDTLERCVHAYDYEAESGEIANKRVLWAPGGDEAHAGPDGHAMDEEGHLWIALFFAGKVVRVSPTGKKVAEIRLPTRCVTCPAFGGKDFDELYITTAKEFDADSASAENLEQGGNTFMCKVGVKGRRPNLVKMDLAKLHL